MQTIPSMTTVSVIIPTFNRAWTLEKAIDSVLGQTYPLTELVVVNDGSVDRTPDILESYERSYPNRIRVIHTANRGVSAARNTGISQSSGDLVALLDSDDAWTKDKVSIQVAFFNAHPDALICQTEEIWIRNGKRVNPKKKHKKPSGLIFEPSLHLCLVSPSAVMMRRRLFDRVGTFNESFPVCEDYDLWLRISAESIPIHLIDTPCTIKTGGHEDQLSKNHSQDKFRIRSILGLLDKGGLIPEHRYAALNVLREKCRIFGQGCIKRGDVAQGEYYLGLMETVS